MIECDVRDGVDMLQGERPEDALAGMAVRRGATRQAADLPRADLRALVEASLTELHGAVDALAFATGPETAGGAGPDGQPEAVKAEPSRRSSRRLPIPFP